MAAGRGFPRSLFDGPKEGVLRFPRFETFHGGGAVTEGDFVIESESFRAILAPDSKVEKIAGGFGFTEGPVWMGDHLIFSDLRKDRLHRWTAEDGASVFREPTGRVQWQYPRS